MPKYEYVAMDTGGSMIRGTLEANSETEAQQSLWGKEYTILELTAYSVKLGTSKIRRHSKASMDDKIVFFQQLATLINAAVPVLQALQALVTQSESSALANAANDMCQEISSGSPLWLSMQRHKKLFEYTWIQLVKTGEESGRLDIVLNQLAENLEASRGVRQKIVSALFYPAILIATSIAAVIFMTVKVIPQFAEFFSSTGQDLPALTKGVLAFSHFMRKFLPVMVVGVVGAVYGFKAYIKTEFGHLQYDFFRMKVPIIGDLTISSALEKFTDLFQLLLNSGIDTISALNAIEGAFGDNLIYRNAVKEVKSNVTMGHPLGAALINASVFPPMMTNLVNVGEESGKLPEILKKLNTYYRKRIETIITRLTAVFEPLIILFMGGVVAVLVLSIYLPIFKMATGSGLK